MLVALTWTAFIMTGAPTTHQLAFVVQSATYDKTPVDLSYSASAAIAGFIGGPFFYPPLYAAFGRPAVLFWGVLAQLSTQIWASRMTAQDDYIPFVVSRLFSGCLSILPISIGNSYIVEAFFLHQRGRLYALFELCFLFGVFAIPTISGFILQAQAPEWTDLFWWTIGPLGVAAVLVFLFMHETTYDRITGEAYSPKTDYWLSNRLQTFLMAWKHLPAWNRRSVWKHTSAPFILTLMPVSISKSCSCTDLQQYVLTNTVPGLYNMVAYGFSVLVQLLLSIFLQTPTAAGGYGFTPLRNAYFSFVSWVALLAAEIVGLALNDSIPLWVTKRAGGRWAPEARLWPIAVPAIIMPIGLGIYGATLEYRLHCMVLALGQFLIQFSAQLSVPICNSYVIECFTGYAVEVTVAMNTWRLVLAVALPFTSNSWLAATGPGWMFGVGALLNLFVSVLILLVAWKGAAVRSLVTKSSFYQSEEGAQVVSSSESAHSVRDHVEKAQKA